MHRIPLPLPMDGLRAVNVYVLETDDGLTLHRRRLGDRGRPATCSSSRSRRSTTQVGDITPVPRHPRAPRPLHAGRHRPPRVRRARQPRDRRQGDARRHPRRDPDRDPTRTSRCSQRAGAPDIAARGASSRGARPRPVVCGTTPTRGSRATHPSRSATAPSTPCTTPGHTRGHFVFADRAAGLLFAGDHVLPTITPSIGFEPAVAAAAAGRLPRLAAPRSAGCPTSRCCPPTARSRRRSHARVDELLAHHDAPARAVPRGGRRRCAARRTTSRACCPGRATSAPSATLDVFNAALATLETTRPPRAAGRPRRRRARRGSDGDVVYRRAPSARAATPSSSNSGPLTSKPYDAYHAASPVCASSRTSRSPISASAASHQLVARARDHALTGPRRRDRSARACRRRGGAGTRPARRRPRPARCRVVGSRSRPSRSG